MSVIEQLTEYLQDAYIQDTPLEFETINDFLRDAKSGGIDWSHSEHSENSDGGMPALHYACLNEATEPQQLFFVISALLMHGADPKAKDSDNETALEAILSLSQEEPEEEALKAHMASMRALINCPNQPLGKDEIAGICGWLRQHYSEDVQKQVLGDLEKRLGKEKVTAAWTSEMFLKYCEQCAYDAKTSLKSHIVGQYLEMGADVCGRKNGASALLLMILNPYTGFEEMSRICPMVIQKDPQVVCQRDGFKMTPFNWASDYENVSLQHSVKPPNPAVLLALAPAIFTICPDLAEGSGACCLKVKKTGASTGQIVNAPLRFLEGDRVLCRVEAPGNLTTWEEGVVVGLWYKEKDWPPQFQGAPYEVKLDIGSHVYALVDHSGLIQREAREKRATLGASGYGNGNGNANAKPQGRFQKRQREDGSWELLDTKSGKARACSPPDSDED